jgi:hypothetical protein
VPDRNVPFVYFTVPRTQMGTSQINLNGRGVTLALDQRGVFRKQKADLGAYKS